MGIAHDERRRRVRQKRVVLAVVATVKLSRRCVSPAGSDCIVSPQSDGGKTNSSPGSNCVGRPVIGRAQGWRYAPPPPAADGLAPVHSPGSLLVVARCGAPTSYEQVVAASGVVRSGFQVSPRATIVLRMCKNLRMQATKATFLGLPAAHSLA